MAEIVTPISGEVICTIPDSTLADVDNALDLATSSFVNWRLMPPSQRGHLLIKAAQLMRERADEIATLETLNTGKKFQDTKREALRAADCFEY